MDIVECKDKIIRQVYDVCKKNGIEVWHDLSNTTESVYFWIKYGNAKVKFRISDHLCSLNQITKTLVLKEHTKTTMIERFVINRIKTLKYVYRQMALQSILSASSYQQAYA